jgi:hypothetical protein
MVGTLTEEVVLELVPSDPRWLWDHPDAVEVAGVRSITLTLGSTPARELAWLLVDPVLWSDGLVPSAVPAGLDAPRRMPVSPYRRWWSSTRLPAEVYSRGPGGGVPDAADVTLTQFAPATLRRAAAGRARLRAGGRGGR